MSHQQVFGISDKNVIYRNRHALIGRAIDDQDIDRIVNLLNITDEPTNSTDLARVLETTHSNTKAKGSSTAFIIALTHQGLSAINLGDSGFMVVRKWVYCIAKINPLAPLDYILVSLLFVMCIMLIHPIGEELGINKS